MFISRFSVFLFAGVILAGCDFSNKEDGSTERPYLELMISGEEGQDSLSVLLQIQYVIDEEEGGARLNEGVSAMVQDQPLVLDSAGVTGYFYTARVAYPADSMINFQIFSSGKPVLSQKHEVNKPEIGVPEEFTKEELQVTHPGERSRFRVSIVDTAFLTNDVSGIYTSSGESLKIPGADLAPLVPGPVFLTITWEKRKTLDHSRYMGEISSKYSIFRESFLR